MKKTRPRRVEAVATSAPPELEPGPPDLLAPVDPLMEELAQVALGLLPFEEVDDTVMAVRLYLETHPAIRDRLRLLARAEADESGPLAVGAEDDSKAGSGG